MSEFRNRIITISGEPASGKSTVINKLREDYEKRGYKVHIYSVGNEFRRLAVEKALSIEQFNEYVSKRSNIDEILDSAVKQRGKEINLKERPTDIYIFDSRLAFHNIPDAFSVRLTVDKKVAGERVFNDNKRGNEDKYDTVEQAIEQTKKRKESEVKRYKERYGVDLQDPDNYNLVIDTSYATIEDISQLIDQCLERDLDNKPYSKLWSSPKLLLPRQRELDTFGTGFGSGLYFDEFVEKLNKEGYDPTSQIKIIELEGKKYICEGHHRNFGAWKIGKTLVPYTVIAKDDEFARSRVGVLNKDSLYGHESLFDEKDENGKITKSFSYNEIYPGIYNEKTENALQNQTKVEELEERD